MRFLSRIILCLVIALFMGRQSRLQTIPDSLVSKLNNAPNDSVKARTLLDIGETIEENNPATSLSYYKRALALSEKINNNRVILSSLNDIGVCYIELNKMDSAINSFVQAIPVARRMNDTLRVARVLANIGNVYLHKQDRISAIDFYLQSARLWETCSDQNSLPGLYSNISWLFTEQKEYDKAIEYGNKAFTLAQKIGDDYSAVNALLNLSGTYSELHKVEKQFELLQKALPLAKKNKNIEQIATVYDNLGNYYFEKKQYQQSLANYLESYKYVQQLGNQFHLCEICTRLAFVYNKLNENDKALKYILQAEALANQVKERANLKEIYQARGEIEKSRGNFKLAYEYLEKSTALSDSLFKVGTSEQVAEVEAKYQNEKKQQQISQLESDKKIQTLSIRQKSTLNSFLIAAIGALLVVGFLGYRNIRHSRQLARQQHELQQQRIRELEKDRQLVVVDSMLKGQEEERSRLAKDLHDGLGGMLSGVKYSLTNMKSNLIISNENAAVFERSLDMIDSSISELRRVAHNMMPETLIKFGLDEALKDYCNSINVANILQVKYQSFGMEKRLEASTEIIIYRIIQELLNNTIKHASATETLVQLLREGNRLSITVEDNGKGFDPNDLQKSKGAGWANIKSRVDYLKGKMDLNSEPGKGVSVNIEIMLSDPENVSNPV
jgi:signal transduction histidine kinase